MANLTTREALLLVLDAVDYTKGACGPTEMVGAVLPETVIEQARASLAAKAHDTERRDEG